MCFRVNGNQKMRRPGIEPGPPAWQASILPLNQRRLTDNIEARSTIFQVVVIVREEKPVKNLSDVSERKLCTLKTLLHATSFS